LLPHCNKSNDDAASSGQQPPYVHLKRRERLARKAEKAASAHASRDASAAITNRTATAKISDALRTANDIARSRIAIESYDSSSKKTMNSQKRNASAVVLPTAEIDRTADGDDDRMAVQPLKKKQKPNPQSQSQTLRPPPSATPALSSAIADSSAIKSVDDVERDDYDDDLAPIDVFASSAATIAPPAMTPATPATQKTISQPQQSQPQSKRMRTNSTAAAVPTPEPKFLSSPSPSPLPPPNAVVTKSKPKRKPKSATSAGSSSGGNKAMSSLREQLKASRNSSKAKSAAATQASFSLSSLFGQFRGF
jgi:hypothetical protein